MKKETIEMNTTEFFNLAGIIWQPLALTFGVGCLIFSGVKQLRPSVKSSDLLTVMAILWLPVVAVLAPPEFVAIAPKILLSYCFIWLLLAGLNKNQEGI